MVEPQRFELWTSTSKASCSTIELHILDFSCLRRALVLLTWLPAFLNNAKATNWLRSLAVCFRFISVSLCWNYIIQLTRICVNYGWWWKTEESNPIPFLRTWFSRPVAGPSPLHHLPFFWSPMKDSNLRFPRSKQGGIAASPMGDKLLTLCLRHHSPVQKSVL